MNKYLKWVFVVAVLCISSCINKSTISHKENVQVSKNNDTLNLSTIDTIAEVLFSNGMTNNARIESLKSKYNIIYLREYSEEDNYSWPSIKFLDRNGTLVFKAEANWTDTLQVHRITFYTKDFSTSANISVGDTFKRVKNRIDINRLNESIDGELLLYDSENQWLSYYFDVSDYANLIDGINSLDEVPSSLRIETIVCFRPISIKM